MLSVSSTTQNSQFATFDHPIVSAGTPHPWQEIDMFGQEETSRTMNCRCPLFLRKRSKSGCYESPEILDQRKGEGAWFPVANGAAVYLYDRHEFGATPCYKAFIGGIDVVLC